MHQNIPLELYQGNAILKSFRYRLFGCLSHCTITPQPLPRYFVSYHFLLRRLICMLYRLRNTVSKAHMTTLKTASTCPVSNCRCQMSIKTNSFLIDLIAFSKAQKILMPKDICQLACLGCAETTIRLAKCTLRRWCRVYFVFSTNTEIILTYTASFASWRLSCPNVSLVPTRQCLSTPLLFLLRLSFFFFFVFLTAWTVEIL